MAHVAHEQSLSLFLVPLPTTSLLSRPGLSITKDIEMVERPIWFKTQAYKPMSSERPDERGFIN
jgi:hypothetical protein